MVISAVAAAVVYTVFLWWFSTGAILWLDRRPRTTYKWSLLVATGIAAASVYGLAASASDPSPSGAVLAFTCALGLWGWHELSFLMGFVAGPRTSACPENVSEWRRFRLATSTLVYHEIALAVTAAILVAFTMSSQNRIGCWTFIILLLSRLSAKLNLFFGVPNFTDEFFPEHLKYLTTYLRKGPASGLFPLSITLGVALVWIEGWLALNPNANAFESVGFSLLFALTALALIEHAFMIMPLPDSALWRWALPGPDKRGAPP